MHLGQQPAIVAGNAHASFGIAPPPPTAEEMMATHDETPSPAVTPREPMLSKLSSLGRFLTLPLAPAADDSGPPSSRSQASRGPTVSTSECP